MARQAAVISAVEISIIKPHEHDLCSLKLSYTPMATWYIHHQQHYYIVISMVMAREVIMIKYRQGIMAALGMGLK